MTEAFPAQVRRNAGFYGESGIALMVVLWVLTLVMVIAGQFAFTVRQELQAVRRFKESAEAYYIAEAGIVEALLALVRDRTGGEAPEDPDAEPMEDPTAAEEEPPDWRINVPVGPVPFANGRYTVSIGNESGRVDLNTADPPLLRMVLGGLLEDDGQVDELVDAILDWRDADDLHRLNGAESDYYESLPVPYRCKNGPFDTVDELLYVKGVTPELFFGSLRESFTLRQSPFETGLSRVAALPAQASAAGNRINPNAAPTAVLKLLPEMTEDLVEAVTAFRREQDFKTYNDIADVIGADVLAAISPYISLELSPYYTIRAEGMVNDSSVRQRITLRIRMDPMLPDRFEVIQRIDG